MVISTPPSAVMGSVAKARADQKAARSAQGSPAKRRRVSNQTTIAVMGQRAKVAARTPSSESPKNRVPRWISQATMGGLE